MLDLLGYDKMQVTIERIRQFEPPEGYYLAFSGGKDSVVLKTLANIAGVKYDAHMSWTSVDPPEVMDFVRRYHPDVIFDRPKKTMWQLIIKNKFPPTRLMRFCCSELKECHGMNRVILTGIRGDESNKRKNRGMIELCRTDPRKRYVHPLIDWTQSDVWEFIKTRNVPYCSLYDKGFDRIGCVMCPQASHKQRLFEAERFPNFYRAYMRVFDKLIKTYPNHYTSFHSA
jgi:phosphoadenosine phosphosulfate reductase